MIIDKIDVGILIQFFNSCNCSFFIALFALWSVPNHRLYYEKLDLNNCDCKLYERKIILNVQKSRCLYGFLVISNLIITLTLMQYYLIERCFQNSSIFLSVILALEIIIAGFVIGETYNIFLKHSNYNDYVEDKYKRLALYLLVTVHILIYCDIEMFVLCLSVLIGKFMWIDWYIDYKGVSISDYLKSKIGSVKNDEVNKKIITFCFALLIPNILFRICTLYLLKDNNSAFRYIFYFIIGLSSYMFYIVPVIKNCIAQRKEFNEMLMLDIISLAKTEEQKEQLLDNYLDGKLDKFLNYYRKALSKNKHK